jgi:hypothetical protein
MVADRVGKASEHFYRERTLLHKLIGREAPAGKLAYG